MRPTGELESIQRQSSPVGTIEIIALHRPHHHAFQCFRLTQPAFHLHHLIRGMVRVTCAVRNAPGIGLHQDFQRIHFHGNIGVQGGRPGVSGIVAFFVYALSLPTIDAQTGNHAVMPGR